MGGNLTKVKGAHAHGGGRREDQTDFDHVSTTTNSAMPFWPLWTEVI